ncbi:MAG: ligase-associated DNA damage response endonuclease PdeM [Rhodobacteraceae bacterium]|nr:ligase-associated DNA damage response endonuclease PdeM [Paracoccaceae bacterium]
MNGYALTLAGAALVALPSGALWWPERRLLAVADLHLGRSERAARRGGTLLPPYETEDTLARLDAEIGRLAPATVLCLGDSFDDGDAAACLAERHVLWITRMQAGRRWLWVAGNHDPGPPGLGGSHLAECREGPLVFRHVALAGAAGDGSGEVSGHYHPKARLAGRARACFLCDDRRLILPAYGTYTGGLDICAPALASLVGPKGLALILGPRVVAVPLQGLRAGVSASSASR